VGMYGEDMDQRHDELLANAVKTMQGIIRDTGAECIVPLGGALIPYVVDPNDIAKEIGIPVFNTKSTSIRFAEACFALGMSHSPITYPTAKLNPEDFVAHAYS